MSKTLPDPQFPPLLKGHVFKNKTGLIEYVKAKTDEGSFSAGDLIWSTATKRAECAIVLEPDIPRSQTLAMVPLAMVAIADSLGAIAPPNLAITFGWPNKIYANDALVGQVGMEFPRELNRAEQPQTSTSPDFAILSIRIEIESEQSSSLEEQEPGANLTTTVLYEEGCGEIDRTQIIESWSRHFLTWLDSWEQEGFKAVQENWMYRAKKGNQFLSIKKNKSSYQGKISGLDEYGGLLLENETGTHVIPLSEIWFAASN
jgi:biotin-(acetyl-CoA carboxylase) ligase